MIIQLLKQELTRDEGLRYTPYADTTGHQSIGVGHNMDASPLPSTWGIPLSAWQVDQLLTHDITIVIASLDLHLPWWTTLDEVRQRCLANMCFNLGIGGLMGFHNALGDLQQGYFLNASQEFQESLWYKQVGYRAARICNAIKTGLMDS